MGEKTRRRLLFFYILILLAAVILRLVYVVLDVGYHALWAAPWAMRYNWYFTFCIRPMAMAALGAIPALWVETGHLHGLHKPMRLLLLLICILPVLILTIYPLIWLSGVVSGDVARWLWIQVYYAAVEPVCCTLLGFAGGFGLRLWLDRKGDV